MNLKTNIILVNKNTVTFILLLFVFTNSIFAQTSASIEAHLPALKSPSDWIGYSTKIIFNTSKELGSISDASTLEKDINGLNDNYDKLKLNHKAIEAQSNLRNFYNLRNQFGLLIEQTNRFNKKLKKTDAILIHQLQMIDALSNHSLVNTVLNDSIASFENTTQFKKNYLSLDSLKNNIELLQKSYTLNISFCTYIILSAKEEDEMINREMDNITKNLLHPEELSFLHLAENNYPAFWPTFKTTCSQKLDLLLSYSKASLWDLILLRVVVLLFAFVPLWYVKKIFRKNESNIPG